MTKIGTFDQEGYVFLNWLDTDSGERGTDYFSLVALREAGYGDVRMRDIVVRVASEKMEKAEQ